MQLDTIQRLGLYPQELGPPGGGACYSCASWFAPSSQCCPSCNSAATLSIRTLSPSQEKWLQSYVTSILSPRRWLRCIAHLPPWTAMLIVSIAHQWLHHLHSHLNRWTVNCIPSIPIMSNDRTVYFWLDGADHLRHHAPHTIWMYAADAAGCLTLHSLPSTCLGTTPPCQLAAGTCPRCGRPSPLAAILLLPTRCQSCAVTVLFPGFFFPQPAPLL